MSFRSYFGIGLVVATLVVTALFIPALVESDRYGMPKEPIFGMMAMLGMFAGGLGGMLATIISFFTYIGWNEDQVSKYIAEERWRTAAWTSPLAMLWTGSWVFQIYSNPYANAKWLGYIMFGLPFIVILLGSLQGLLGGFELLKMPDEERRARRQSNYRDW